MLLDRDDPRGLTNPPVSVHGLCVPLYQAKLCLPGGRRGGELAFEAVGPAVLDPERDGEGQEALEQLATCLPAPASGRADPFRSPTDSV